MKQLRLNRAVKRLTILRKDTATGKFAPVSEFRQGRKRKKRSPGLRMIEKVVRRLSRAQATAAAVYSERHERSNRKKKDGWLKNLIPNVVKAQRKGVKILRK
jgi:hypothetical protein